MPGHQRSPQAARLSEVSPALANGPIAILGQMPDASNAAFLVRCGEGTAEELAVYKPARGETPLWDFPEGTLHRREVAAYEVAKILGWPNVPATVLRDGPEGPGSLQRFVRFDPNEHFFTLQGSRTGDFALIAAFDVVINNADRKGGHCLLGEDDGIWVIDHGVCFAEEPKLRTVIWDFIGEPLEAEVIAGLERLRGGLGRGGALRDRLDDLLSPAETDATAARTEALLRAGAYPEPDPMTRPFPWPPI